MHPFDAILRTNPGYVEDLLRAYENDPRSVPASWAAFFAGWEMGLSERPVASGSSSEAALLSLAADGSPILLTADGGVPEGLDKALLSQSLPVYDLVHSYREYGHLAADIDPLGRSSRTNPLLDLSEFGLTEPDLARRATCATFKAFREGTIGEFLQALRETYCGHVAVEFIDEVEKEQRDWLTDAMEPVRNRPALPPDEKRRLLREVVTADSFEEALGRAFPGGKRFSLEGGTTLVPLLCALIERGAEAGVEQVVMGMAHRGRLNVLANVLGKPLEFILAEFEGRPLPPESLGYGDVKYHLGWSRTHLARNGKPVELSLEFNPSHLETVNPVVEGIVRAKQNRLGDGERTRVLPVLMHGDAAVAAQGVVSETLLLAGLKAYTTGGTVHVIINNQVGFTTDPEESRPTRYCSEIAKMARAPIFHVNGDDPEACVHVARTALEYRQRFKSDVVIDLVCYRRHGHNELDDPSFTQPVMYKLVKAHASNSRVYAGRLAEEGVATPEDVDALAAEFQERFDRAHAQAKGMDQQHVEGLGPAWDGLGPAGDDWSAVTKVDRASLERVARAIVAAPQGFHWHPRLKRLMQQRADMVLKDQPMDWGCAEALAVGTLLIEGTKVRLTGQDTGRGTFSHRHAVYTDMETGERHVPLNHVQPGQNTFTIVNSPLSEEAVLGFEYGYSTADPWTLNCWEAQFGDFVNGAQVVIDQLIASCEFKWGRMSGLVLLLPHGYEGQGPEHSSARVERFLELCAECNMQVANLTTPAQYFHVLRRQMRRSFRKPLVLMTPKSLLRHELAVSRVADLTDGSFRELIDDDAEERDGIERVLLCSGKVYWTLFQHRRDLWAAGEAHDVALVRVEQLYPFPGLALRELLGSYPQLRQVTWVQEEPRNMGPWRHLRHRIETALPSGVRLAYAGRHSAAVPATGSHEVHEREELELLAAAFSPEGGQVAGERLVARREAAAAGEEAASIQQPRIPGMPAEPAAATSPRRDRRH